MTYTKILDLVYNAIVIRGVKSGNIYLISNQNHLCGIWQDETWKLPTGEFSINYYECNPDFEIIEKSNEK